MSASIQERDMDLMKPSKPLAPTRTRTRHTSGPMNPKWTQEEDVLLRELVSKGDPNWQEISGSFSGKSSNQVSDRWSKVLNPNLLKGSWTGEEDLVIVQWVKDNGPKLWGSLAEKLPGRIPKQCRERWHNHLCPTVSKSDWTKEEDDILIAHQQKWGNKWSKIAVLLPGRTDNAVKNRWNSSLKRRIDRAMQGQTEYIKRGRKPKRISEAPTDDIPKPSFEGAIVKVQDFANSPINIESPITPLRGFLGSPNFYPFSPTIGAPWSPNSPGLADPWKDMGSMSPFNPVHNHDVHGVSSIPGPKLD